MNRTYFFGHTEYDKGTGLGTYTHYFSAHTPKKLKEQIQDMMPHFNEHYPAIEVYDTMDVVDYLHGGLTAHDLFCHRCLAIIMPVVALYSENAAPVSWTFTQNASDRKVEELKDLFPKRWNNDTKQTFTDAISEELAQEYTQQTGNNCVVSKWNKDGREPYKTINGYNYYLYTGDDIPF